MSSKASWFSNNDMPSDLTWWLAEDENEKNDDAGLGKSEENEKDCALFVIDCNEDMFEANDENEQKNVAFQNVCIAVVECLKHKIIKSKDDLVSIVLFNTRDSKNPMNHNHIFLFSSPDNPNAQLIKNVRELPSYFHEKIGSLGKQKGCEFRDLLWTLQNIFTEVDVQGTKFGFKRVFIFTKNDNPCHKDRNATIAKAKDMLDAGIEINVFPLTVQHKFVIKTFYQDICTFDLDELTTEQLLHSNCPTLNDLIDALRVKETKKRCFISCPLTIANDLHVAVKLYVTYRHAKRESPTWLDARTNQPLQTETRWICKETGAILDDLSIKTYYEYGPEKLKIYFTKDEIKKLKEFGEPSLQLMGFKSMDRLKPYFNIKPSYFMYPDEERIQGSTLLFHSLIIAMKELNQFGIAKFIPRKSSGLRFVALIPQPEVINKETKQQEKPNGIHIIFLPFADDIRKIVVPNHVRVFDLNNQDSNENNNNDNNNDNNNNKGDLIVHKAKEIIDKLEIKAENYSAPANPVLQKHYDALEAIALEEDINENDFVDEIMPNDEHLIQMAGDAIEEFNLLIPGGYENNVNVKAEEKKIIGVKRKLEGEQVGRKAHIIKKEESDDVSNDSKFDWKKLCENDELNNLTINELKIYLSEHGLKLSGRKADLIARIKEHMNSQ